MRGGARSGAVGVVAEAKAALLGLEVGKELGLRNIVIERDCLSLVQDVQRGSQGRSNFDLVLDDITDLFTSFDNVSFSFVKRSGNKVAHILAHLQPWEFGKRFWVHNFPCNVFAVATAEI